MTNTGIRYPPGVSRLGLALSLISLVTVAPGCSRESPTGVAIDRAIREPSGIVASPQHRDVFWVHGDSGTGNWIYAVDRSGKLLARYRVRGAQNVDWEDITHDDEGYLWLADTGNNNGDRRDLSLYRVREPDPRAGDDTGQVEVERRVRFHYADQREFGVDDHNWDSESLLWFDGRPWLLTKHRGDRWTVLYRFPTLADLEGEVVPERISSLDLGAQIVGTPSRWPGRATGADVAEDGRHLALLTYDNALVFAIAPGDDDLLANQVNHIDFDPKVLRQVEALAWDGDELVICNEERAVFRVADPLTTTRYSP